MSEQLEQYSGQPEQPGRLKLAWLHLRYWLRSLDKQNMSIVEWQLNSLPVSAPDIPRPEVLDPHSAIEEAQRIIRESSGGQDTGI